MTCCDDARRLTVCAWMPMSTTKLRYCVSAPSGSLATLAMALALSPWYGVVGVLDAATFVGSEIATVMSLALVPVKNAPPGCGFGVVGGGGVGDGIVVMSQPLACWSLTVWMSVRATLSRPATVSGIVLVSASRCEAILPVLIPAAEPLSANCTCTGL